MLPIAESVEAEPAGKVLGSGGIPEGDDTRDCVVVRDAEVFP